MLNPGLTDKLVNSTGEPINPATSEKQDEIITNQENLPTAFNNEALWLLRRLVKIMESQGTVDSQNRQRVYIDGGNIVLSAYYAGASQFNIPNSTVFAPGYNGTSITYVQPVQTGPVDPRWQIIDQARLVSEQGIRSHLSFT